MQPLSVVYVYLASRLHLKVYFPTHTPHTAAIPVFEQTVYTVPENDRTVPLCIDIGVEITESLTYTITAVQKSPPEAEGL